MGSLSLLIFPTQGSNPGLLHCRQLLYQLSHQGSPRILKWVAYPFSSRSSRPRNRTGVSCTAGVFFTKYGYYKYVCVLSRLVVSDSLRPHGLWPTRLFCPCGFSRQEYLSGLPCPPLGDLPNSGIETASLALAGGFFTTSTTWEAQEY